jgi:hypothetical protein
VFASGPMPAFGHEASYRAIGTNFAAMTEICSFK